MTSSVDKSSPHSALAHLQAGIFDLNGVMRGKRMPPEALEKLCASGFAMPLSVQNVDASGADIEGSTYVFATGDKDGQARWTGRAPLPVSWLDREAALLPMALHHQDGRPFEGCPRAGLNAMVSQLAEAGISPKAGIELEFTLLTKAGEAICAEAEILSLHALDRIDDVLARIDTAGAAMDIHYESITSEAGAGQFELVFSASDDIVKLAEDVLLMKHLIISEAERAGYQCVFAAKPLSQQPGNGLHLHLSLSTTDGTNIFAADGALLEQAVAGILSILAEASLILSPFPASYERLVAHSHAPTAICWGHDNRTVAVRIPAGPDAARRLEVRSASGEANPYLLLMVILAAATEGMGLQMQPPPAVSGDAYSQDLPQLPADFDTALAVFADSEAMRRYLPEALFDMFLASKRQDGRMATRMAIQAQGE